MLLMDKDTVFLKAMFKNESEIEDVVLNNFQQLFGNYSILLPKAKVTTMGGRGSIPDGIIINFETKEWFIIEVERGEHGTWEHIAPQISKQITAFSNDETEEKIKSLCITEISDNASFKDVLSEIGISELQIHSQLNDIFKRSPIIALPIDEIPPDLIEWAQTLKNEVRIWEIKKYSNGDSIIYSLPDDALPSVATRIKGRSTIVDTEITRTNYWTLVYNADLVKDGEELYFDYGSKGSKKTHFKGIVRSSGVEVFGEICSPSIAALRCIQKVTPTRNTANGWTIWKTKDGKYISELYRGILESSSEDK